MRIAVAATAPFGAAILEGLAGRGYDIELLLTRPDKPQGRGRKRAAPPAKESAKRFDIPVEQPDRLTAFPGEARVVVIAGYGVLVPEKLLAERLWLNVHPSLLPRWRGAAPVERAIMAGDRETGVTIHKTTADLDAGPRRRAAAAGLARPAGAGGFPAGRGRRRGARRATRGRQAHDRGGVPTRTPIELHSE
jgi:methionyl-tRNA formyltransferase